MASLSHFPITYMSTEAPEAPTDVLDAKEASPDPAVVDRIVSEIGEVPEEVDVDVHNVVESLIAEEGKMRKAMTATEYHTTKLRESDVLASDGERDGNSALTFAARIIRTVVRNIGGILDKPAKEEA